MSFLVRSRRHAAHLVDPKMRLLDALAFGPTPVACMFLPEEDYKLCFGASWHGLELDDCWRAVSDLLARGFLSLRRGSTAAPAGKTFLGVTGKGGRAWETAFGVDWNYHIKIEAEESVGNESRYLFTSPTTAVLEELLSALSDSPSRTFYSLGEIQQHSRWTATNWKTFDAAFSLRIGVRWDGSPAWAAADKEWSAHADRLGKAFKSKT